MALKYRVRAKTDINKDGTALFSNIGRIMDTKSGLMLKLDVIPVEWTGFAYLSVPLEQEARPEEE